MINEDDEVDVRIAIRNTTDLFWLLATANAIDGRFAIKGELFIDYLLGARSDREMLPGDSHDLKVVAQMINSCNFRKVRILDPHSDVSTSLIARSQGVDNKFLVDKYDGTNSVLICPDGGAVKKVEKYLAWNNNLTDVVYCNKTRDLKDKGRVTLTVLEPQKCAGRNCVIIDDLCDGGGTFLKIAEQIEPAHLTLIVTHGVFSKGSNALRFAFDKIICSDSYTSPTEDFIEVVPYNIVTQ